MKSLSSFSAVALTAIFTLWLGCSSTPTSPDSQLNQIPAISNSGNTGNTDSETGALPSFPTSFLNLLDPHLDVFVVRLVWGSGRDSVISNIGAVDWSGTLSLNAEGALVVRRTIGFEDGQDKLFPQSTRHAVSWHSIAEGDRDGIETEIYIRNDINYIVEPRLSFETAQLAVSFSFVQLQALDTVIMVDGIGALAVSAKKFDRTRCPHGPLGGYWRFLHENEGKFEGTIWYQGDTPIATMSGRFFTTDSGERLFVGRWQRYEGILSGEIRGRWEFNPTDSSCIDCGRHSGRFRGAFFTIDGRQIGNLRGRFGAGSDPGISANDPKTGRFKGFWGVDCNRDNAE